MGQVMNPTMIGAVAGLMLAAAIGTALAETKMPDVLINEWCFDYVEKDGVTTWYHVPSWTADGHCTNIFVITPWDFYQSEMSCDPTNVRLKKDVAHSGTAYDVTVTARCYKQRVTTTTSTLKTFKFERYKGSMSVTEVGSKR
jgi:hypothetical protein